MPAIFKTEVADGVHYVAIPEADLYILCGCPADSVKHLMKRGLILERQARGVRFETGPNAILLSDTLLQNGRFANLSEFPILHMFYRQGRIIPGHPNNTGVKPLLVGSRRQVEAQMEYVFRGNYGLASQEELEAAGVEPGLAHDMMRLKRKFAFGKIRRMDEYLDLVALENGKSELRGGVFVKRVRPDVFDISYKGESVRVDLTLPPQAQPGPPYVLGHHHIRRDYFAVLHSGEGDGWDPNRPAMASILLFQGKAYLIDAGPNIMHSLRALGIGVNEIAGVFHTHAHDDHFCGLPDLMRADHRIPYYATPFVRASVTKKLAALSMMREDEFAHYFEYHDLTLGEWNDIDTLEVKPVFSPHPVETTVLFFRTLGRSGYRTYAHLADIASLKLLRGMITADADAPGLSRERYEQIRRDYLAPVDLKKIDIGGGMIHGDAEDFARDASRKIVLAHTALPLTNRQKEIGSGAPFGTVDVLVPSHQEYVRSQAFHTLAAYFPSVPTARLRALLNNPIDRFNPESIILKAGRRAQSVHLLLTGQVEMIRTSHKVFTTLSSGAMLGEPTALAGRASAETYRATNFAQALRIPVEQYRAFVKGNGLFDIMTRQLNVRGFLYADALFGDAMSCARQNAIAAALDIRRYAPGEVIGQCHTPELCLVRSGRVHLQLGERPAVRLGPGDFFREGAVLYGMPCPFEAVAAGPRETVVYHIPAATLADVPIIRWKLLEAHEARIDKAACDATRTAPLGWRKVYTTGAPALDETHRALFASIDAFCRALRGETDAPAQSPDALLAELTRHCEAENRLMERHGYPDREEHARRHGQLLAALRGIDAGEGGRRATNGASAGEFLKGRLLAHVLTDDRRLGTFLQTNAAG